MTCCLIDNEPDLVSALSVGGEIRMDSTVTIALTQTMIVEHPTVLIGGTFTVSSGAAFRITSSDVELRGVSITGGATDYESAQKLIHAHGIASAPLSNVRVRDCQLSDSRADNVWLEWCRGSIVSGNVITSFLYSGVMLISCDGVSVNDNNIADSPLISPVVNVYGIAVTDVEDTEAARSRNCTIVGNRVHLIDWEAIDTHGGDGIVITGNTVTASPRGVALVVGNTERSIAPQNCVVSGNRIDGRGVRQPIDPGVFLGGIANTPADATVTGNIVTHYPTPFFLNYTDRAKTYIGANNAPLREWTPITLDGDFRENDSFLPEYKIDGNTVYLRGGVIPDSATQRQIIGHLPDASAWPSALSFTGYTKGSNSGAGNGMVGVWPDGTVEFFYYSGTDTWTYFLSGSYEAA